LFLYYGEERIRVSAKASREKGKSGWKAWSLEHGFCQSFTKVKSTCTQGFQPVLVEVFLRKIESQQDSPTEAINFAKPKFRASTLPPGGSGLSFILALTSNELLIFLFLRSGSFPCSDPFRHAYHVYCGFSLE
jgi:hypothetical protein